METNEIVNAVISYVRDENAKYAILIDGAWGSGKTYLYENYLVDAVNSIELGKNERKYNVYISLYGVSTIASLAKQLLTNYFIYVKGKGNKIVKKGLKPVVGMIGVVSNAFSFSQAMARFLTPSLLTLYAASISVSHKSTLVNAAQFITASIPFKALFTELISQISSSASSGAKNVICPSV